MDTTTPTTKPRCPAAGCKKKLNLLAFSCRCGPRFCELHRLPESHACAYDHHAAAISTLKVQLGGAVVADKMDGRI